MENSSYRACAGDNEHAQMNKLCKVSDSIATLQRRRDNGSNNVEWQAVEQEAFDEPSPSHPVASFPSEEVITEHSPDMPLSASEPEDPTDSRYFSNSPNIFEDTEVTYTASGKKACSGPDLRIKATGSESVLNTFVHDVENALYYPDAKEFYRYSKSSVNSELSSWSTADGSQTNLGFTDSETEGSVASSGWTWKQGEGDVGCAGGESAVVFRRQPNSFMDRTQRFVRRGRDRLSLSDLNRSRQSVEEGRRNPQFQWQTDTSPKLSNSPHGLSQNQKYLKRSSYSGDDGPKTFLRRPLSALQTSFVGPSTADPSLASSAENPTSRRRRGKSTLSLPAVPISSSQKHLSSSEALTNSQRVSLRNSSDDEIDWSWLDDALTSLDRQAEEQMVSDDTAILIRHEVTPPGPSRSTRADAGCQTQSDPPWDNQRTRSSTSRDAVDLISSVTDAVQCSSASTGNEMVRKPEDESGPSGLNRRGSGGPSVSSWLRQSMRRITHFNLGDPPSDRPASAPAAVTGPAPVHPPTSDTTTTPAADSLGYVSDSTDRQIPPGQRPSRPAETEAGRSPLGPWPHGLSSVLALLGCTLGLFNISRFAVLSVHFGANFILQFVILSVILGIPLFAFHAALGQTLGAGPIDMWGISPVFQGIGIALLLSQALIGIYSMVGVSWMFVYFRDSFITRQDTYRWAEPFLLYREDAGEIPGVYLNQTLGRLDLTVPDYLNGVVLQRHSLASPHSSYGHLKFQLTFNLAVIWMIVFVSLSKGLRSYGKVVYVFSLVPVLGTFVLVIKLLPLAPMMHGLFTHTEWTEFFFNTRSWVAAASEAMLTWNLLGAAAMQVTSHNKATKRLWRDVVVVAVITLFVLILSALLASTCQQLLSFRYSYMPSSFEGIDSNLFLRQKGSYLPPEHFATATPLRGMGHDSMVAGDRVGRLGGIQESGYQVIRLATELMPATLAFLGAEEVSPFWAVLFYFNLILFGVAQQLAIWHCVITGVLAINTKALKSWETTITFFACASGFVLGLPMTTELGVFVVYFLDYCVGGGWWVLLVTLAELCAVLMIRGRPYTGENIASSLFGKCLAFWLTPLLTFIWNVIMPVALLIICITVFKNGGYKEMWVWRGRGYWPYWAREVGVLLQLVPLLSIPVVALIQTYRYLSNGPPDILDRLSNLYRPSSGRASRQGSAPISTTSPAAPATDDSSTPAPPSEDPPPKYTPPPSYSTATGIRIAKMLRQSFRRSFRRLQTALDPQPTPPQPPPPDYHSVLVEMTHDEPPSSYFSVEDVASVLRSSFRHHPRLPENACSSTAPPSLTSSVPPQTGGMSAPSSLLSPSTTTSTLCSP